MLTKRAFARVPGAPIAYWLSDAMRAALLEGRPLGEIADIAAGNGHGGQRTFPPLWWEVSHGDSDLRLSSRDEAARQSAIGGFRTTRVATSGRWYGNQECVVDWEYDGARCRTLSQPKYGSRHARTIKNTISTSNRRSLGRRSASGRPRSVAIRAGFIFDVDGHVDLQRRSDSLLSLAAICNSSSQRSIVRGHLSDAELRGRDILRGFPVSRGRRDSACDGARARSSSSRSTGIAVETSWELRSAFDLVAPRRSPGGRLAMRRSSQGAQQRRRAQELENENESTLPKRTA